MRPFSVMGALRMHYIFIAVFVIGCYLWLLYIEPFCKDRALRRLRRPAWWQLAIAFVGIGGLGWWSRDIILDRMDVSVFLPYVSPNFLIAFGALAWLFMRLRAVLRTPVDDLIKILGLEVPVSPIASLLDITSSGVTVHWKPPEQRSSVVKYAVRINGITAGEVSHQESAVIISGLVSGRCYAIRIVAINSSNFQASSDAIRVKVVENGGEDQTSAAAKAKASDSDRATQRSALPAHPAPTVTACKPFPETIAAPAAPAMARDHSSSHSQVKRGSIGRRGSPAVPSATQVSSRDRNKEAETIQTLNAKLDSIRSQIREQEKQDEEEEAEFQTSQASLLAQRDDLKRQLKERDEESKDLNKSVKTLEHANSAIQNKKLQLEKTLNEKLRAREKMQEDMAKWEKEIPTLQEETASLKTQREELLESSEKTIREIKEYQIPDLQALNFIEEQIQERGKEMQELDREKKNLDDGTELLESSDRTLEFAAEEKEWNDRIASLQAQIQNAMTACWQAQSIHQQAQQRVDMLHAYRTGHVNEHAGSIPIDPSMPASETSQPYQGSTMRVNFDLPENRPAPMSLHNRNGTGSSTSYRTSSPFRTSGAHMSLPHRQTSSPGQQMSDLESLTGGAMISPSAGNLLPSGLFGDDTEDLQESQLRELPQRADRINRSRPSSTVSRPLSASFAKGTDHSSNDPDYLPGLGTLPGLGISDNTRHDPPTSNSPTSPAASFGSASQSAVSSPHSSLANLHSQKASEGHIESDRRSIRSASGSSRNVAAPRRFDFFGRQRGKTTSDDGPALGSLKSKQSQSMPRDSDAERQASNVFRAPQRVTGGLFGQMSSAVLGRRALHSSAAEQSNSTYASTDGIAAQMNPWARSLAGRGQSASRPGSTYSTENAFPAPSNDSPRFGWGISRESLHRPGNIHSAAGRTNPWSPLPSRRPSINQEPSNISIREIGDAEDDSGPEPESKTSPPPAPIGTKPKSKDLDSAKQLNPNARDFTSVFGFGRKADKAEKDTIKAKKKTKSPQVDDSGALMASDSSPSESRKSRETRLSSSTGSFENLVIDEHADGSTSTPQESSTQGGTGGRDSLRRILSRKSSAGKFSLPTRKDKSGLFSRKANQVDDTEDESGSSAKLGKSIDSTTSNALGTPDKRSSGFSLPSFKKRSKKGDEAPSISETSMTSGTGDEEESRPSVEEEVEPTFV